MYIFRCRCTLNVPLAFILHDFKHLYIEYDNNTDRALLRFFTSIILVSSLIQIYRYFARDNIVHLHYRYSPITVHHGQNLHRSFTIVKFNLINQDRLNSYRTALRRYLPLNISLRVRKKALDYLSFLTFPTLPSYS